MTITRTFNLCLNKGNGVVPHINISQYDEEVWKFKLYTENGQRFIPVTGSIIGVKADGRLIDNQGTVDSTGQVVINVTQQMTAAAGKAEFELLIENQSHGTANFVVDVEQRAGENAIPSESDLSLLQEAVNSSQEILDIIGDTDLEEVVKDDIDAWLNAHPEATTTVQDDSLTTPKYKNGSVTKAKLNSDAFDGMMMKSISGNPVVFEDGADGIPVKSLKADMNPVQNLNGFDHPWVGGAGKNLLSPTVRTATAGDVTYSVATNGKITLTGNCTGNQSFTIFTGTEKTVAETAKYTVSLYGATNAKVNGAKYATLTVNAGSTPSGFIISVTSGTTYNESFYVMFEKGETPSTYVPYENICPIYPANGKNLADFRNGYGVDTSGQVVAYGTRIATVNPITINSGVSYKVIFGGNATGAIYAVFNGSTLVRRNFGLASGAVLDTSGGDKLYVCVYAGESVTVTIDSSHAMVVDSSITDFTYQPYQGIMVDVEGKNLLPMTLSALKASNTRGTWNGNTYTDTTTVTFRVDTDSNGNVTQIVANGTGTAAGVFYIRAYDLPNGSYIFSGCPSGAAWNTKYRIRIGDKTDAYINDLLSEEKTITVTNGITLQINTGSGYACNNLVFKPMIRYASVADATYEPYQSASYPYTLGQSVYGGTVDLATGVLTVTMKAVNLGDFTWQYNANWNGGSAFYSQFAVSDAKKPAANVVPNALCSLYKVKSRDQVYNQQTEYGICISPGTGGDLSLRDFRYTDPTTFKSAVNGELFVYELETPQTIQLTPTQIATALGYNKISCDCNGKLDVIYRVDGTVIQNQNDELIEKLFVKDEATGNPASFSDGADDVPVKSLKVNLNPVQGGTGDQSPTNIRPIVAANGINVWDEQWEVGSISTANGENTSSTTVIRSKNYISVYSNAQYYAKCSANMTFRYYDANKNYIGYSDKNGTQDTHDTVIVMPSNCHYLRFAVYPAYGTTYNHDISINYPSTYTAYVPYQGIVVEQTGKNLIWTNKDATASGITCTRNSDGTYAVTGTATGVAINAWLAGGYSTNNKLLKIPAGTVIATDCVIYFHYEDGTLRGFGSENTLGGRRSTINTFTEPAWIDGVRCPSAVNGATYNMTIYPQLEYGTEASNYEPYVGNSYPYTLGQSVYGGSVDLATGLLTVDKVMVDLGSLAWNNADNTGWVQQVVTMTDAVSTPNSQVADIYCDIYAKESADAVYQRRANNVICINSSKRIQLYSTALASMSGANVQSYLSGHQLVYPLATPQTIQLTPTEVKTLLGYNNILSSGTVDVIYHADTKLYVDKMTAVDNAIIAPTEADFVATRNYTTNDLVIVNDTLYKVTANIASGSTITPNSNVTQTTLGALIKALS